ncbi:transcriptional repressor NrdR [Candidatus Woesearchaeota archaeon]|nr:transcriptional repressor NrdR [Candidatus Woesearchaeota archaeon]
MKCPFCSNPDTKVLDKRETEELEVTRRRRECLKCRKRFTTYERIETVELFVVKKDDRREQFNLDKLKTGIIKACEKRPISMEQIEQALNSIMAELKEKNKKEIQSREIGELLMRKLKKLDQVAYIRFASVYQDFQDLSSFKKEVSRLEKKRKINKK